MEVKLDHALSAPDRKRRYNQRLFTTIAERYDLITRVLSFGRDQSWKAKVVELAGVTANDRVLDLACGTGDLAARSAETGAHQRTASDWGESHRWSADGRSWTEDGDLLRCGRW